MFLIVRRWIALWLLLLLLLLLLLMWCRLGNLLLLLMLLLLLLLMHHLSRLHLLAHWFRGLRHLFRNFNRKCVQIVKVDSSMETFTKNRVPCCVCIWNCGIWWYGPPWWACICGCCCIICWFGLTTIIGGGIICTICSPFIFFSSLLLLLTTNQYTLIQQCTPNEKTLWNIIHKFRSLW